jgi:hypothetical protein
VLLFFHFPFNLSLSMLKLQLPGNSKVRSGIVRRTGTG